MLNLVFRLDASKKIGGGHLSRCISIAEYAKKYNNFRIHFISNYKDEILSEKLKKIKHNLVNPKTNYEKFNYKKDINFTLSYIKNLNDIIMIVDHYKIDAKWEKIIKKYCIKLIIIDDLANRRHFCDILLDQNLISNYQTRYYKLINKNCKVLTGPKYALLAPEYLNKNKNVRKKNEYKKRILIFFGSYDFYSLTIKVLKLIIKNIDHYNLKIEIILNQKHPTFKIINKLITNHNNINLHKTTNSLISFFKSTDIFIGTYGMNFWERAHFKIFSIMISTNEEQKKFLKYLDKNNYCNYLGSHNNFSQNKLIQKLKILIKNNNKNIYLRNDFDGLGCVRLIDHFTNISSKIIFRDFIDTDIFILYQWLNNTNIRKYSFNKGIVSINDHLNWFKRNYKKNFFYFFINELKNEVGMVRFTKFKKEYIVSFLVDPNFHMRKIGFKILSYSLNNFTKNKDIKVNAKVFLDNIASNKIFEKLSYNKTYFNNYILYYKKYKNKI